MPRHNELSRGAGLLRLLEICNMISGPRWWAAQDIADRTGMSRKTTYRDLRILGAVMPFALEIRTPDSKDIAYYYRLKSDWFDRTIRNRRPA